MANDPVESALAEALVKATAGGEWPLVAQLAKELEARRTAKQASGVVSLDAERARREGKAVGSSQ